ncbi:hypothetical protein AKJ50_01640 [candidate division MSBL1 archaeon SCGC-AAA382A13]|uniref:Uncharacterized protein n=1 Tax=candidate division MSBL1 archaeon SCGC-AAA382A13 TaxID=1698279 RepID=A0A133VFH4_9EURY|nr:hypothetical protein AKJ50_01640 [candidate division MSBL1 archaeon SCGC-AAA382A13]
MLIFFWSGANKDETLKLLKEELSHLVSNYLSEKYAEFREEKLEELKRERPNLFLSLSISSLFLFFLSFQNKCMSLSFQQ